MLVFKIRDIATGMFSTGGTSPHFTKKGKVWAAPNHVSAHLNLVNYKNAEVVTYEIVENELETKSVAEWHKT